MSSAELPSRAEHFKRTKRCQSQRAGGLFQAPARVWYSPSARPKERDSSSSTVWPQAPHPIFLRRAEGSAPAPRAPRSPPRGSSLGQGQPQGLWEGTGGLWRAMGADGEGEGGRSSARRDELRPSRVRLRTSRVRPFPRADPRHLPSSGLWRGTSRTAPGCLRVPRNGDLAPSVLPQHPPFIPALQIPAFPTIPVALALQNRQQTPWARQLW